MGAHSKETKNTWVKKIAFGAAAISLLSIGSIATVSAFTDSVPANVTAAAGTIDLKVNGAKTTTVAFGSTLKPGDIIPEKTFTLNNSGTIPLTYDIKAVGAGKLAEVLDITITGPGTYTSKLNNIDTPDYTLAAGASMVVRLNAKWVSTASDNTYQGTDGKTTLTIAARS